MTPQDFPRPRTIREAAGIDALCGTEGASVPTMLRRAVSSAEQMRQGYLSEYRTLRYVVERELLRFTAGQPSESRPTVFAVCLLCPRKQRTVWQQNRLRRSRLYHMDGGFPGFAVNVYSQPWEQGAEPPAAHWIGAIRGFSGLPFDWVHCITQLAIHDGHAREDLERHIARLFGTPTFGNAHDLLRFRA